jgi:CDP-4-dehydro-6-deoxyglucose reductase
MTTTSSRPFTHAPYRVAELDYLHCAVVRLRLLPTTARHLHYRCGQYISLELADGEQRSYSPAAPLSADGAIELHVRLYPDGRFSGLIRNGLAALGSLKVHGPYGDCVWQTPHSTEAPVILLATGTGIAPIKALLLAALAQGCSNPLWLYWGARHADELYAREQFKTLEQQHGNFHFVEVLSPEHVQDRAARQHPQLADAMVYACGLPAMIDAARTLLTGQCGLAEAHFFADAFVTATPSATEGNGTAPARMIHTTFRSPTGNGSLRIASGATLLCGLRAAGVLKGVCGGRQSCGTCRVSLDESDYALLAPISRNEQRLLKALPGADDLDRLACQIVLEPALDGMHFTITAQAI